MGDKVTEGKEECDVRRRRKRITHLLQTAAKVDLI
jgi:hypothetical protein